MGFSARIKKFFYEDLGFDDNRSISKAMGDYNEQLIGRYLNSDEISATWIKKINQYFGDKVDFNYLLKDEMNFSKVQEPNVKYNKRSLEIIEELQEKLKELKETCH